MKETHSILIASIGDDIHSVGMALLTLGFREAGFVVKNLGIGNSLNDVFTQAKDFDAVLISCLNGHAALYLEDFPRKLAEFERKNNAPRVWYLGGNLSIKDDAETVIRHYLAMGFDFVSPFPMAWQDILDRLLRDFYHKGIKKRFININRFFEDTTPKFDLEQVDDEPLSDAAFVAMRERVLATWPTGDQVYTTDIDRNHRDPTKNLHHLILRRQNQQGFPLLQPRTGVADTNGQIALLRYLRQAGLDVSSIQLDAASRKNKYDKAAVGVEHSQASQTSSLNGYPIPIHGVQAVEKIMQEIDTPFQVRGGSPDHRLTYEIALAGGASAVEGGFICYLYPYDKKTSPVESLKLWRYIDKLTAWYHRHFDTIINREYFGPLTTTLLEPSIPIVINTIQAVLSAKWGVRCISVGIAEQGNRYQDIAAVRVLKEMTNHYLFKYGFRECTVSTVYHQYMAAFPTATEKAAGLILNSSVTAGLSGTDRIMIKTPVEAFQIPRKEDNAEALRLTQMGLKRAQDQTIDQEKLWQEVMLLKRSVSTILNCIESLGQGSLARGVLLAFSEGILDIPFSPHIHNRSRLITVRDQDGAVRFANPEILPFDNELIDFHKEKIHQRKVSERVHRYVDMQERDLTRIANNDFMHWPLDGVYIN